MAAVHAQAQGQGEGCAQQHGRQEDDAQGGNREACAHAAQGVATEQQHGLFGLGLQHDQPAAEYGDFHQSEEPGSCNQQAERTPWVADAIGASGVQGAAQHQAGEVGGQDHGEGEGTGAHELHDGLGPDHFVAQGHATGNGIQDQGQARHVAGGNRFDRSLLCSDRRAGIGQCAEQGGQVEHSGGIGRPFHTECGNQHESAEQGASDGPGGIGGIQAPAGAAQGFCCWGQGTHQHGQGAAHQEGR
ncbi:hypothetical protein D9M71_351010 [compost metagenome]